MDLSQLLLTPTLVNLILDLVSHLLLLGEVLLVELVHLLALTELVLLLLELLPHPHLPVSRSCALLLVFLICLQDCVLVQRCPLINFIFEATHDGVRIKLFIVLNDAEILLESLLE